MRKVLYFEPDSVLLERHRIELEQHHYLVAGFTTKEDALHYLRYNAVGICIWARGTDTASPVHEIRKVRPELPVVIYSESANPSLIVSEMRAGATDFWQLNENLGQLIDILDEAWRRSQGTMVESNLSEHFPGLIGRHPRMLEIMRTIWNLQNSDSTVLITGESGTGKEVVAQAIHSLSPRRRQGLVAVNCGAIPPTLLESELFGHVKGAFTGATVNRTGRFQLAGQGTLFLDEISDLPFDLQAKILRAIQNRTFEPVGSPHSIELQARLIAATNVDLTKAVAEKKFREDLFYRLNVIPIHLPPLRERKSDLPLLISCFIQKFCLISGRTFHGISEDAMRILVDYQWPGNVRELENMMERVVVLKNEEGVIDPVDLPIEHFQNVYLDRYLSEIKLPVDGLDLNQIVHNIERDLILQALKRTSGNKNRAAELLRLNRTTLVEKIKRKGLKILAA